MSSDTIMLLILAIGILAVAWVGRVYVDRLFEDLKD